MANEQDTSLSSHVQAPKTWMGTLWAVVWIVLATALGLVVHQILTTHIEDCPLIVVRAEKTNDWSLKATFCKRFASEVKIDAERKRQAEMRAVTPVAAAEAPKAQTQSAPAPVPVTAPTPVAPPPVLASVEPPPPVVAAPVDPVRKLCPSLVIPTGAASVSTFDSQVCAIAACAGESASVDDNIAMLVGWRNLTNGLERDACRAGDRAFLSDNKTMGRVLDAIEQAPIPEADPAHDVCRAIRNKAVISMNAARPRLLPPDRIPATCPKTAGDTSAAVMAFIDRFGLR